MSAAQDFVNLITLRGAGHALAGTLGGVDGQPRIVHVDGHTVEIPPADHMLIVRNDDRPGMIGLVGQTLGEAGVNIADMHLGRSADGSAAMMVLATSDSVPGDVVAALVASPGIDTVHSVNRPGA